MYRLNKIIGIFLQLTTMATFKGGYDYEFIDPPPNSLECSICLLTLRDPQIISCCGNHFCHTCIGRIQGDGKPCPLCNEPNFTTFLHKGVKREVNALMIRCRWRQLGCDWEGELGQLQEHLHPGAGSKGKGCGYVIIECVYKCGDRFERRMIQDHELDACPRRPMEVQMSRLARKFEASLRANEKKLNDVIAENKQLKEKVHLLEEKHDNLESELDTRIVPAPVPPFYFSMPNYEDYRKDSIWASPSFYSNPGGYKLCCQVCPKGVAENYLSLYVHICRGEFDDKLKWPFNGVINVQLFNRQTDKWENNRKIVLDDSMPIAIRKRAEDVFSSDGCGYRQWISSDNIQNKYVRKGIIRFKVSEVILM